MSEFIGIIWEQLGTTFKWCFTGFLITIVTLILLYKNNLLGKSGPLSFIKKISYYLFFPLYIGIITWFFAATYTVEKDALKLAEMSIDAAENSLFPEFYEYAVSLADQYVGDKIKSKKQLVDDYLNKQGYLKGNFSTKTMRWTLENALSYIEDQAIAKGTIKIGQENINFPRLISEYLKKDDKLTLVPFSYLKGMSYKTIHGYASSFYWLYFWLAFVVIFILLLDIYFTLKRKKKKELKWVDPSTTLDNHQEQLSNTQKSLDGFKKIP